MNTEMKQKWLEALRSGKYVQAKGGLRYTVVAEGEDLSFAHCCLGVLCDVVDPTKWQQVGKGNAYMDTSGAPWTGVLPYTLTMELKISRDDMGDLISMNDRYGKNFGEIADWIEVKL